MNKAIEAVPGRRIDNDVFDRAVVRRRRGHVAPIHAADAVRVLLQVETRGRRGPGNQGGVRRREPDA